MTETQSETPETNNEGQVAESLLTSQEADQQSQEQQSQEATPEGHSASATTPCKNDLHAV